MKLIFSVILLSLWELVTAPPTETCHQPDAVRLFENQDKVYPQVCNEVNETLEWNYFCGKFRMAESQVFCRALGFVDFTSPGGRTSSISGPKVQDLDCVGNETRITDCAHDDTNNECLISEGVTCDRCNLSSDCLEGVCLMNGTCVCSTACQNGGYCFVGRCVCLDGFEGIDCSQCSPPCQNDGRCSASANCECKNGYYGERCELFNTTNVFSTHLNLTVQSSTMAPNATDGITIEISLAIMLIIIAAGIPSVICICTVLVICVVIMCGLGFMMSNRKALVTEKNEGRTAKSNNSQAPLSSPRHIYELDDINALNHPYYYIENSEIQNQVRATSEVKNQPRDDHYVIMELKHEGTDLQDSGNYSEMYPNQAAELSPNHQARNPYVIDDLNESL